MQSFDRVALRLHFLLQLQYFIITVVLQLLQVVLGCVLLQVILYLPYVFLVRLEGQDFVKLLYHLLHLPVTLAVIQNDLFEFLHRNNSLLVKLLVVLVESVTFELFPYFVYFRILHFFLQLLCQHGGTRLAVLYVLLVLVQLALKILYALPQLCRNGILRFDLIEVLVAFVIKLLDEFVDARLEIVVILQIVEYLVQLLLVVVELGSDHGFPRALLDFILQVLELHQLRVLDQNVLQVDVSDVFRKEYMQLFENFVE